MKTIAGLLVAALLLALGAGALVGVGRYERDMADAQEYASTERYDEARTRLDDAQRYVEYSRWIPRVGAAAENDVRTRRTALDYWQRNYEAVLPRLSERGLIVADNTLWSGRVLDGDVPIAGFNEHVAADPRTVQVILSVRDGMSLIRRA